MNNRGSFTVEAALSLPIFIFSIAAFIFLFQVILLQIQLQGALTEASYGMQEALYIKDREWKGNKNLSFMDAAAFKVLSKEEVEKYFFNREQYNSILKNGIFYGISNYNSKKGDIDLVALYTVRIPLPLIHKERILACQRIRTRTFSGVEHLLSLSDLDKGGKGGTTEYVYVTETGTVYHLELTCSSLNLKITQCRLQEIDKKRNASGGKYKPCERCFNKYNKVANVLICEDGDRYHSSIECSGLKRTIRKVPLEEVREQMRACYRCGRKN